MTWRWPASSKAGYRKRSEFRSPTITTGAAGLSRSMMARLRSACCTRTSSIPPWGPDPSDLRWSTTNQKVRWVSLSSSRAASRICTLGGVRSRRTCCRTLMRRPSTRMAEPSYSPCLSPNAARPRWVLACSTSCTVWVVASHSPTTWASRTARHTFARRYAQQRYLPDALSSRSKAERASGSPLGVDVRMLYPTTTTSLSTRSGSSRPSPLRKCDGTPRFVTSHPASLASPRAQRLSSLRWSPRSTKRHPVAPPGTMRTLPASHALLQRHPRRRRHVGPVWGEGDGSGARHLKKWGGGWAPPLGESARVTGAGCPAVPGPGGRRRPAAAAAGRQGALPALLHGARLVRRRRARCPACAGPRARPTPRRLRRHHPGRPHPCRRRRRRRPRPRPAAPPARRRRLRRRRRRRPALPPARRRRAASCACAGAARAPRARRGGAGAARAPARATRPRSARGPRPPCARTGRRTTAGAAPPPPPAARTRRRGPAGRARVRLRQAVERRLGERRAAAGRPRGHGDERRHAAGVHDGRRAAPRPKGEAVQRRRGLHPRLVGPAVAVGPQQRHGGHPLGEHRRHRVVAAAAAPARRLPRPRVRERLRSAPAACSRTPSSSPPRLARARPRAARPGESHGRHAPLGAAAGQVAQRGRHERCAAGGTRAAAAAARAGWRRGGRRPRPPRAAACARLRAQRLRRPRGRREQARVRLARPHRRARARQRGHQHGHRPGRHERLLARRAARGPAGLPGVPNPTRLSPSSAGGGAREASGHGTSRTSAATPAARTAARWAGSPAAR